MLPGLWPVDLQPAVAVSQPSHRPRRPGPSAPPGSPARTSWGCIAVGPASHRGPGLSHRWLPAWCILLPGWPCLQTWGPPAPCLLPLLGHQVQASWPVPPCCTSGLVSRLTTRAACRLPPWPASPSACTLGKMVPILYLSGMEFPKGRDLLFSFEERLKSRIFTPNPVHARPMSSWTGLRALTHWPARRVDTTLRFRRCPDVQPTSGWGARPNCPRWACLWQVSLK